MYDIYQLRQAFNYYGIYMLKLAISSYSYYTTIKNIISVFSCSVNTSALSMRLFYDSIQDDEGMS